MIDPAEKSYADTIAVAVRTRYLDEQSSPGHSRYVYSYTITISNHGDEPVQLISRHWIISDQNLPTKEVRGPGVVGEQPVIQAGKSYTYSSGVVMESEVGTMCGSYQMQTLSGEAFEAPVPIFALIQPNMLN
jgi:ApaG protein